MRVLDGGISADCPAALHYVRWAPPEAVEDGGVSAARRDALVREALAVVHAREPGPMLDVVFEWMWCRGADVVPRLRAEVGAAPSRVTGQ